MAAASRRRWTFYLLRSVCMHRWLVTAELRVPDASGTGGGAPSLRTLSAARQHKVRSSAPIRRNGGGMRGTLLPFASSEGV